MNNIIKILVIGLLSSTSDAAFAQAAQMEDAAPQAHRGSSGTDDIIVTARRRDESSIAVPVSIAAFSGETLEQKAITNLGALSSQMPSLIVTEGPGGSAGAVYLRGIGTTGSTATTFDQTVSINLDGVQLSRGNVIKLGMIDMAQIEILRGPQALFFGKNSPAGVISVTSRDPSDRLELMGRVGYEFNARERIVEAMASGPLTSTLGGRLAVAYSDMDGWVKNLAGRAAGPANAIRPGSVFDPLNDRGPDRRSITARATLLFDPSEDFQVRGKLNYSRQNGIGAVRGSKQRVYCPYGLAQYGVPAATLAPASAGFTDAQRAALERALAVDDCKPDNQYAVGDISPANLAGNVPGVDDPRGHVKTELLLGSVQVDYSPSEFLQITSVTGYAKLDEGRYDSFTYGVSDYTAIIAIKQPLTYSQFSQELRVSTSFDAPVNLLFGGLYNDNKLKSTVQLFSPLAPGDEDPTRPGGNFIPQRVNGKTYSLFGQALWDMTDQLELSGGVRWTQEQKSSSVVRNGVPIPLVPSKLKFQNYSPELTLSWRPNTDTTFFVAYKEGFKSGGFSAPFSSNSVLVTPEGVPIPQTTSYAPEAVSGFEAGVHARMFDGQLRMDLGAYTYDYTDLQVNAIDNASGLPVVRVANAAAAKLEGIEAELKVRPNALPGLQLSLAANYNIAKYTEFLATCYIGQTVAEGCNRTMAPTGRFVSQDLSGVMLPNASRWTGSVGAAYTHHVGDGLKLFVSADASYRSRYNPHPEADPGALQKSVWYLNGLVSVSGQNNAWEISLIGRNLTKEYRAIGDITGVPITGNAAFTGSNTLGGRPDLTGNVNRGREFLVQLTLRPSEW